MDEKPIGSEDQNKAVGEGIDFAIQQKMPGVESLDDFSFIVNHRLTHMCTDHWYCRARMRLIRSAFDSLIRFRCRAGRLSEGTTGLTRMVFAIRVRSLSVLFTLRALVFRLLSALLPRHVEDQHADL